MRTRYLVCYDITDEGRLTRVHRYLKGIGVPVQYSVFLCSFTWLELQEVVSRLNHLIDVQADDVRLYPLPSGDTITALGCGDRLPDGATVVLP
ncbi:MAG TPA: CRISPR-associated endonuclease Cas2 [Nitrospiraceae bacterium]|jgi:CRISPR-associated protein Cas2|nr:CRISPR-associated endonuclease Cas2 [Nitrospiraceae bacterium]